MIRPSPKINKAIPNLRKSNVIGLVLNDENIFKPCKNKERLQNVDIKLQIINSIKVLIANFEACKRILFWFWLIHKPSKSFQFPA